MKNRSFTWKLSLDVGGLGSNFKGLGQFSVLAAQAFERFSEDDIVGVAS